ncbi:MAG: IS630 transposase-related protein [Candidatus Bathyarchaeota archaeon]|nr:IS630 transposase-related protein [Candidatus Termiticorpusculum sp.]
MKPISVEDREKIIKYKANGESEKNIAKWLMIGSSTVYQILALHKKKTGSIQPKPYKGNNRKITSVQDTKIREVIKKTPDITINELITALDLKITESGLSKHLKKMGLTFQKRCAIQTINNEIELSKLETLGEKYKKS